MAYYSDTMNYYIYGKDNDENILIRCVNAYRMNFPSCRVTNVICDCVYYDIDKYYEIKMYGDKNIQRDYVTFKLNINNKEYNANIKVDDFINFEGKIIIE